jgi:hypothetical protein
MANEYNIIAEINPKPRINLDIQIKLYEKYL